MLSTFDNQFPPHEKYHSPKKNNTFLTNTLNFIKFFPHYSSRLTVFLVFALLLQALAIILFSHNSSPLQLSPPNKQNLDVPKHELCEFGKVFVYDLPKRFNKNLLDNCHELDPWKSRCNTITNGGFGPKAGLAGDVVPENLSPAWYWTDMYAAEVIYHVRMTSYKCRTEIPEEATAYYIPFYAGLDVWRYFWSNHTARDHDSKRVLNWLKDQPYWKRSNGSDHFIMLGSLTWDFRRKTDNDTDWGSSFFFMPLMKNVLRILVERFPWDALEVSVPYPTAFHPRSESDIIEWQTHARTRVRKSLFTFVGAARNKYKDDFRGILVNHCKNESESCRLVDCSLTNCIDGALEIFEAYLGSDFCLQPRGEGYTRRSFFDCMLAGSIPVYFWDLSFKDQYRWHLPENAETYSVFIDRGDVRVGTKSIKKVLEGISREEIRKMRERVIDLIPRFLYASSSEGLGKSKDAFDITIEEVLRKFRQQRNQQEIFVRERKSIMK